MSKDAYEDGPLVRFTPGECILIRPALCTEGGTFAETVALLQGYDYALNRFADGSHKDEAESWMDFIQWLTEKYELNDSRKSLFADFRRKCGSDQEAHRLLHELSTSFFKEQLAKENV